MEFQIELLINAVKVDWTDIGVIHPIADANWKVLVHEYMFIPLHSESPVHLQVFGKLAGWNNPSPVRHETGLKEFAWNGVDYGIISPTRHPIDQFVERVTPRHTQFRVGQFKSLYALQFHDLDAHVHAELLEKVTPDQFVHKLFHVFTRRTDQTDQFSHFVQLFGRYVAEWQVCPNFGGYIHT